MKIYNYCSIPKEIERLKSFDDVYEILGGQYVFKLRLGIHKFLQEIRSIFDISIYTLGGRKYANAVNKLLKYEAGFSKGSWVISKKDCVEDLQKRLDVDLSHEEVVVIVDDMEEIWDTRVRIILLKSIIINFLVKKEKDVGVIDIELDRVTKVLKGVHGRFFEEDKGHIDVRELSKLILEEERKRRKKLVINLGNKRLRSENDIMDMDMNIMLLLAHSCVSDAKRCKNLMIKLGRLAH
ncbi:RNA polymerase II C-terminal domain phosphatase-like 4 [Bienertia sinuspersici]